jgi:hypothetical protein
MPIIDLRLLFQAQMLFQPGEFPRVESNYAWIPAKLKREYCALFYIASSSSDFYQISSRGTLSRGADYILSALTYFYFLAREILYKINTPITI